MEDNYCDDIGKIWNQNGSKNVHKYYEKFIANLHSVKN